MLSRRTFLQSTALALSRPAGNALCAAVTAPARLQVITDHACADGRLFRRALPLPAAATGVDAGTYLQSIADALRQQHFDILLGLSRNSDFVLLNQTACEHGYRMIYHGQHHYDAGGIRHTLSADPAVVDEVSEALVADQHIWPRGLAAAIPVLARSGGTAATATLHAAARRPADSQGFLLSWAFTRRSTA